MAESTSRITGHEDAGTRHKVSVERQVRVNEITAQADKGLLCRTITNPGLAGPAGVLRLQALTGNRAVASLIQTKLMVGAAGDRYEQETDQITRYAFNMPAPAQPAKSRETPGRAQRATPEEEEVQTKSFATYITPLVRRQIENDYLPNARRLLTVDSQTTAVQRVAPAVVPIVIWFGKALAATSIDALIDFAIATITGMPPPGFWAHVGSFFVNLVPGLSEAKKVKKVAKLLKVIDKIIDIVKTFRKLKVPGASNLLHRMSKEADFFREAISGGKLSKAKEALGRLLGFLREAQVASKLKETGAKIVQLGKSIKVGKKIVTEVDIVTEEAGRMVLNQVKAGKRAMLRPGSTSWPEFINQVDRTVDAARELKAKVRYVVDDISAEARQYLTGKGIEIRSTSEILK